MSIKSIWTSIRDFFLGKPKIKYRHLTDLEEEEKEEKIRQLIKYTRSLEAQISRRQAKDRLKKVEEKDKEDDLDLIKELQKKQKEIDSQQYRISYDLGKLFFRLFNDKDFAKSLEIADKDDKVVFDKFKTFRILEDRKLAIQGKSGRIWSKGHLLKSVIFKPETLGNQIRRRRILIPYDENLMPHIDLENEEMPEMSYNPEEGIWNISEEQIEKVKHQLMKRDIQINNLREDKQHLEKTIADMRNKNQDLKLAKESWKSQAENSQSELAIALENEMETNKKFGKLDRDITTSREQKELADEINKKYQEAFKVILKELEDKKSQTIVRKVKDETQRDIVWAKQQIPKEIHTTINKEEPEEKPIKPGQKIG